LLAYTAVKVWIVPFACCSSIDDLEDLVFQLAVSIELVSMSLVCLVDFHLIKDMPPKLRVEDMQENNLLGEVSELQIDPPTKAFDHDDISIQGSQAVVNIPENRILHVVSIRPVEKRVIVLCGCSP
jgi:hypothetical protein